VRNPDRTSIENMHDEAIHAIAETGGSISIIQCPYYLQEQLDAKGRRIYDGPMDVIIDSYDMIARKLDSWVGDGWKHLSFGSDFDGGIACIPNDMRNGGDLPLFTQRLLDRNVTPLQIHDLYSENFLRTWERARLGP
jgi:membrane dipeptidase